MKYMLTIMVVFILGIASASAAVYTAQADPAQFDSCYLNGCVFIVQKEGGTGKYSDVVIVSLTVDYAGGLTVNFGAFGDTYKSGEIDPDQSAFTLYDTEGRSLIGSIVTIDDLKYPGYSKIVSASFRTE